MYQSSSTLAIRVLGLTRSEPGAQALLGSRAEVLRGSLEDLEILRNGVAQSGGVIDCAFDHEKYQESGELEKHVIAAFGSALAGSSRPLIVSAGLGLLSPKRPVTENIDAPTISHTPRSPQQVARALRLQGLNVTIVRVPQVHNTKSRAS